VVTTPAGRLSGSPESGSPERIHLRRRCGPGSESDRFDCFRVMIHLRRRCGLGSESDRFDCFRVIFFVFYLAPSLGGSGPCPSGSRKRCTGHGRSKAGGRAIERWSSRTPLFGKRWSKTILAPFKIFNFAAVFLWFKSADGRLCAAHPRLHLALQNAVDLSLATVSVSNA
jgi:hypothetical protein